jgi:CDP-diglyceride synthetase
MNGQRIIIAVLSHAGLLAVLAVDWLLHTHLGSLALLTVVAALALSELYPMLRRMGLDAHAGYGIAALSVLFLLRGLLGYAGLGEEAVRTVVLATFAFVVVAPFYPAMFRGSGQGGGNPEPLSVVAATHLGMLLIWYTLSFLLELRLVGSGEGAAVVGLELTFILLLCVKLGDSAAYLVGKSIGVRPLTAISPRKTWEGAGGSLLGSVLTAVAVGTVLGYVLWQMILFGVIVSVAGQLGDLLESHLKRRAGVKDSGTFFRESGGFLDMVDSLLLAAPAGYVYVRFVVL